MKNQKIEVLKDIYENINSPIIICDNKYNILWVNQFGINNTAGISTNLNLTKLFPVFNLNINTQDLKKGIPCETSIIQFGFTSISLYLTPIINNKTLSEPIQPLSKLDQNYQFNDNTNLNTNVRSDIEFIVVFIKIHNKGNQVPIDLEISKVISSITTQFRSPLFSIFNMLTPISRKMEEQEQYSDLEYIRHIAKNCYKLIKSTVNLSEYFKLQDNNNFKLDFKRVNLNKFLKDLCKSIQIILTASQIELEYNITDISINTNIDTDKFSIAFLNVIANSCTFSSKHSVINVSLDYSNTDAIITVSDNGSGIESKHITEIFKPYFSFNHDSSIPNGIGLGLTIVKKVVDAHKGSYIVESNPNKGTTIVLRFPIIEDDNTTPYLESNTANYIANKFSPLYIYLADLCDFNSF